MKKTFKTFGIAALAALIGFSIITCKVEGGDNGSSVNDPVPNELIGTWKTVDPSNYTNPDFATFTINTISIQINAPGEGLVGTMTMNVITVTPATNTNTDTDTITYPSGYVISGTISAATGNMGYLVGVTISTSIYLNSARDEFILVVPSGIEVDNGGKWGKQ